MARTIKKLTAMDAAYLYMETPEVPMHVGSMALFKLPGKYRGDFFEDMKSMIGGRLHLAPMLNWKLAHTPLDIDRPSWIEDEQFDIDRHILRGALPAPADIPTLQRLVGWMHAKLLNRARPLWEIYVFEGLPDHQVAIYSKMHHACIDGGAGAAMTQLLYDATPTPRETAKPTAGKADKQSDDRDFVSSLVSSSLQFWNLSDRSSLLPKIDTPRTGKTDLGSVLVDAFMDSLSQGRQFVESLPNILKVINEVGGKIASPGGLADLKKMAAPPTPLNGTISSERSYATASLSMSRVKAVAAKAGVKLNDVVLAISSGVLRQHLLKQHALPDKSLTAFVPISTREAGDASASNQVMGMICQLATDIADPKVRLETIFAESAKAKELSSPLKQLMPLVSDTVALGSPMGIQVLSLFYSRSNLANVLPPAVNVAISNVFGPKFTLYANGAELLHSYPVSIVTHGMGLNITLQSYRDWLDFGFIAAANILPDTQTMANALPDELAQLEKAYGLPA
ncbi:MAG TPA: wax ester/triacylglycerol synthase family O-acyltransferase [Roseiarcus sp.]|jgi:diacylglycerol O-acyltransferase